MTEKEKVPEEKKSVQLELDEFNEQPIKEIQGGKYAPRLVMKGGLPVINKTDNMFYYISKKKSGLLGGFMPGKKTSFEVKNLVKDFEEHWRYFVAKDGKIVKSLAIPYKKKGE